jgi:mycothiol system anti-sigma-R factor
VADNDCRQALDQIFEYIDHELPDEELRHIGDHLKECPPCEAEHRINEKIKNLVGKCGDEVAPDDLRSRVLDTIRSARADS